MDHKQLHFGRASLQRSETIFGSKRKQRKSVVIGSRRLFVLVVRTYVLERAAVFIGHYLFVGVFYSEIFKLVIISIRKKPITVCLYEHA